MEACAVAISQNTALSGGEAKSPSRLVSLRYLMTLFDLSEYHDAYDRFQNLIRRIEQQTIDGFEMSVIPADLREVLLLMALACKRLGLNDSVGYLIVRALKLCEGRESENVPNAELRERLRAIEFLFGAECDRQRFFTLTTEESKQFGNPELLGPEVTTAFPSEEMAYEIKEAGSCMALGRYTATVFHLMRVLEKGLRALATELAVPFAIPFEYLNWQNIIEQIESAIKDHEKLKAGKIKTDTLKQYAEIAKQFRYFKDAWRNGVAHSRETYDKGQAISILQHVGEFMSDLVKAGLHE